MLYRSFIAWAVAVLLGTPVSIPLQASGQDVGRAEPAGIESERALRGLRLSGGSAELSHADCAVHEHCACTS